MVCAHNSSLCLDMGQSPILLDGGNFPSRTGRRTDPIDDVSVPAVAPIRRRYLRPCVLLVCHTRFPSILPDSAQRTTSGTSAWLWESDTSNYTTSLAIFDVLIPKFEYTVITEVDPVDEWAIIGAIGGLWREFCPRAARASEALPDKSPVPSDAGALAAC